MDVLGKLAALCGVSAGGMSQMESVVEDAFGHGQLTREEASRKRKARKAKKAAKKARRRNRR